MEDMIVLMMGLLTAGFVSTRVAKFFHLPHSVFLVLIGIAAGVALRMRDPVVVHQMGEHFPDLILFALLPPLIFESAYNFKLEDLKKDFVPIGMLAVVALSISTAVIGFGIHWLFGLNLIASLTFGTLISATDPVAVVALFKQVGAPKRLNALVEGESLLNDGTAIVLYRVFIGFISATVFTPSMVTSGLSQFAIVAFGGVAVGLATYFIVSLLLKMVSDSSAQLGLTVAAAYLSFLVADHSFHVSGVISTMVVGLLLGHKARLELNKEALHGMHYIWEFLALAANTLVFFGVGVSIDPAGLKNSLIMILPTLGIVYFARAFAIYSTIPVLNKIKWVPSVDFRYQTVLVWGGLRGGLALALVLLLPANFPHKQLFLSLASAVVLSTLFINALTIEAMLDWFGMKKLSSREQKSYLKLLNKIIHSSLDPFRRASARGQYSADIIERQQNVLNDLAVQRQQEAAVSADENHFELFDSLNSVLAHEQATYNQQLENGALSKKAYIRLQNSVTTRQSLLAENDWQALHSYSFTKLCSTHAPRWSGGRVRSLSLTLEALLHLRLALDEINLDESNQQIHSIIQRWIEVADRSLQTFHSIYPDYGLAIQTHYISAAVSVNAENMVEELLASNIISAAIATRLKSDIEDVHHQQIDESKALQRPSVQQLLRRVPVFAEAPDALLDQLFSKASRHFIEEGSKVVTEGDRGESFYLVTAGMLEVHNAQLAKSDVIPRLFVGDFFGEMSLLFGTPRNATVKAIVPSEVLEIRKETFNELLGQFPAIKEKITDIAQERRAS